MAIFGRRAHDYLLDPIEERRVIRIRRHWAVLLGTLIQTFGVVIGTFLLSLMVGDDLWIVQTALWYLAVAALVRLIWKAMEWWIELIIITDKRFMIYSGLIVARISMMPITRVTDMSFLRTAAGRMLGYGTLRVESAGQKQDLELIEYLPSPERVFDVISNLIFGEKREFKGHVRPRLAPLPRRRRVSQ